VKHTRAKYNEVIQTTNNEELLLNLVRLRYAENLQFLPVTGLNAQFELGAESGFRAGLERSGRDAWGEGRLDFADRPTITFAPHRSPELTKGLLSRIPLDTFYLFAASGFELDRLTRLFVRNINGIENSGAGCPTLSSLPEFAEFHYVAELVGRLQQ